MTSGINEDRLRSNFDSVMVEVRRLRADLEAAQAVIRALDITIECTDPGGHHWAEAGARTRLTPEQWRAVRLAVDPEFAYSSETH